MSDDGTRVAIGATGNSGNGYYSGHVRVFDYDGSAWVQVGEDIDGEADNDYSGTSLAMSDDGTRVAIGAHYPYGGSNDSDNVRVFSGMPLTTPPPQGK